MSSLGLSFTNEYSETVYVAIIWVNRQSHCTGDGWEKKGWWEIQPGATALALNFDLRSDNLFYYYYAESANGVTWSGPYYTRVPSGSFDQCNNATDSGLRTVGFQELDIGSYAGYDVKLTRPN